MTLPKTKEQWKQHIKEKQEKEKRALAEKREASQKAAAKKAWLDDGGTEGAFERAWPELRDEARRQKVQREADRMSQKARQITRNFF